MSSEPEVILDASRMLWRSWRDQPATGIDRACLAYLSHFRGNARLVVQRGGFARILNPDHSLRLSDLLLESSANFRHRAVSILARAFASVQSSSAKSTRGAIYLNVGHTGLDLPGHARWVVASGVRPIYYIHDIIPITHPQYCRPGEAERHRRRIRTALRLARGITTNSLDSERELEAFAAAEGLRMPARLVAPLGLSIDLKRPAAAPLQQPYFLAIGTIEGRKNYGLLLKIWEGLAARLGERTPKLLLIGARGWAAGDVFAALDDNPLIRKFVVECNDASDGELVSYLTHARALLFPSFVEGQGLPLVEALAAGTPAIASDLAVFRETAGDVPSYLHPEDVNGWTDLVLQYLDDDGPCRNAQLARMAHFTAPKWSEHFTRVERWLRHFH